MKPGLSDTPATCKETRKENRRDIYFNNLTHNL